VGRFKSNALVLHHRRLPRNECDSGRLSGSPAAFKSAIDPGLKNQRFDSFRKERTPRPLLLFQKMRGWLRAGTRVRAALRSVRRRLGLASGRPSRHAVRIGSTGRPARCSVRITFSRNGHGRLAGRGARISGLRRSRHCVAFNSRVWVRSGGSRLLGQRAGGQHDAHARNNKQLHTRSFALLPRNQHVVRVEVPGRKN
jgi:hypothetical protein